MDIDHLLSLIPNDLFSPLLWNEMLSQYWYYLLLALVGTLWLVSRMGTKHFYFVRHGQTLLNQAEIRQGEEGSLNESGKFQAEVAGLYLQQFHIKEICSSTYERAKETADIINSKIGTLPICYSPLLAERRNPTSVIGKSYHDDGVKNITARIDDSFHDDDLRVEDEENFVDLKKRARICVRFLECRGTNAICVVTHKVFLQMLLSYILVGEQLHAADYAKLSFFNPADNVGVSVCSYTPWKRFSRSRGWEIISYNENPAKSAIATA